MIHEVTTVVKYNNGDDPDGILNECREFRKNNGMITEIEQDGEVVAEIVESYVLPQPLEMEGESIPAGSWLQTIRVNDDELLASLEKNNTIHEFEISDDEGSVLKMKHNVIKSESFVLGIECEQLKSMTEADIESYVHDMAELSDSKEPKPFIRDELRKNMKAKILKAKYS